MGKCWTWISHDTYVHYVEVNMTLKMRRTRSICKRIDLWVVPFFVYGHGGFVASNGVAKKKKKLNHKKPKKKSSYITHILSLDLNLE